MRGQLTREAVEVVNRLRTEQSNSYEKMKEALLRRYECNQEGYKRIFNENKPEKGESFRCLLKDPQIILLIGLSWQKSNQIMRAVWIFL